MGGGVGVQALLTFAYDRGGRGSGIAYIRIPWLIFGENFAQIHLKLISHLKDAHCDKYWN